MTHPALPHILLRAHSLEPSCSGPRSRRGRSFAETLGWRQGLDKKLKQALALYALILLSTGVGVGLDFVGINPVKALYWTAVINGLLAPFLLVAILIVASDKKLMQGQLSSRLGWIVVAITTVAMFAAGVAMFVV